LSYSNLGVGENPLGRLPGGNTDFNYRSNTVMGGFGGYKWSSANGQAGDNGYAVIYLTVPGVFVHDQSGGWVATKEIYVKVNDVWQLVNAIYIKRNGNWIEAEGDGSTNFGPIDGFFGVVSRPYPTPVPGPEPGGGSDGGGWDYSPSPNDGPPSSEAQGCMASDYSGGESSSPGGGGEGGGDGAGGDGE
jgi:hypothetical protein